MSTQNIPKKIGRYDVIDRLGRGGMGTVYRGRDPKLNRLVAIKLLHLNDESLLERFALEAATAARLDHQNIVKVYDFGEHDGEPFIVMEFVEGVTLADEIRTKAPLSIDRKLQIIEDLSIGLDYAHERDVIHRDVKPANVMVRTDGVVKVVDFGIARVASSGLTQVGMLMGTPQYMSPEQAAGQTVTRTGDVFAVGLVLYEFLSYQQAFSGDTPLEVLDRVVRLTPPPIEQICPGLDPAIARIVHRALQKDPARRYQTLAAMAADIRKVRAGMGTPPPAPRVDDSETVQMQPPRSPTPTPGRTARPSPRDSLSKRRADQIEAHLAAAQAAFDRGEFAVAIAACEQAGLIDPDEPRVLGLLERAQDAIDIAEKERQVRKERQESLAGALARARVSLGQGDIEAAIRAASVILLEDPNNEDARALTKEALAAIEERRRQQQVDLTAKAEIERQRRIFDAGRHNEAIETLSRVAPSHALIDAAIAGMRAEIADIDRRAKEQEELERKARAEAEVRRLAQQQWVAQQMDLARAAVESRLFSDAVETLEHVRQVSPQTPGLDALLETARVGQAAAEAEARREREIGARVAEGTRLLGAGRLEEARAVIDGVLAEVPDRPDALDQRGRIAAALDEQQRVREAITAAQRRFAAGERDAAIRDLEPLAPAHRLASDAVRDLRAQQVEMDRLDKERADRKRRSDQVKTALARARAAFDTGDLDEAVSAADAVLALDPANADVRALKDRAVERRDHIHREAEVKKARAAQAGDPKTLVVSSPGVQEKTTQQVRPPVASARPPEPAKPSAPINWKLYGGLAAVSVLVISGAAYWASLPNPNQKAVTTTSPTTTSMRPTPSTTSVAASPAKPVATDVKSVVLAATALLNQEASATPDDWKQGMALLVDGLNRAPRNAELVALSGQLRQAAVGRAVRAQGAASQSGGSGRPEFTEAVKALESAKRSTDFQTSVAEYSRAEGLFLESAKPLLMASIATTTMPFLPVPITSTSVHSSLPSTSVATTSVATTTTVVPRLTVAEVEGILKRYGDAYRASFQKKDSNLIVAAFVNFKGLLLERWKAEVRDNEYCDYTFSQVEIALVTDTTAQASAASDKSCKPNTRQKEMNHLRRTEKFDLLKTSGAWRLVAQFTGGG